MHGRRPNSCRRWKNSITVEATGKEAAEVIEALAALVDSRFGEGD